MRQPHIVNGVIDCSTIPDTHIPKRLDTSVHSELLMYPQEQEAVSKERSVSAAQRRRERSDTFRLLGA